MPIAEKILRGDVLAASCPSRVVLQHITSRWGVLVLLALDAGPLRFGALRRRINGVSERMLIQSLQCLEGDGLVHRKAYEVVPPHVEYSLTPLGHQATEKLRQLTNWIEENIPLLTSSRGAQHTP